MSKLERDARFNPLYIIISIEYLVPSLFQILKYLIILRVDKRLNLEQFFKTYENIVIAIPVTNPTSLHKKYSKSLTTLGYYSVLISG